MKKVIKVDYRKLRRKSYPSIEDQLDALWKGGNERTVMGMAIRAVKTRFRKN